MSQQAVAQDCDKVTNSLPEPLSRSECWFSLVFETMSHSDVGAYVPPFVPLSVLYRQLAERQCIPSMDMP